MSLPSDSATHEQVAAAARLDRMMLEDYEAKSPDDRQVFDAELVGVFRALAPLSRRGEVMTFFRGVGLDPEGLDAQVVVMSMGCLSAHYARSFDILASALEARVLAPLGSAVRERLGPKPLAADVLDMFQISSPFSTSSKKVWQ